MTKKEQKTIKLDNISRIILEELQENARKDLRHIAKKAKTSLPTISRRITALENAGVIKGYHASVDGAFFDEKETVFTLIKLNLSQTEVKGEPTLEYVCKQLAKYPNVKKVHGLFGQNDVLIEVRGESLKSIGEWLTTTTSKLSGFIRSTESISSLHTAKDTRDVQITT
tara:strand:+ start:841 stop:1347 length:507 start_codon:yes stop_codon:yes gene_type:complete